MKLSFIVKIDYKIIVFLFYSYFISIFILLIPKKATETLIHKVSNYQDLLPDFAVRL